MKRDGARILLFKIFVGLGFALGIILFGQSISTYVEVSGSLTARAAPGNRDVRQSSPARTLAAGYTPGPERTFAMKQQLSLYLMRISDSLDSLRDSLVVGVSASLTLMGALIILALRFPKYLRGQQVQSQAQLARQVQADLLPARDLKSPQFDFASECLPAGEVGGDFCDVFPIGDNRTALVLGDVSGKGISAALLMALIHGAIQSMCWARTAADHEDATLSLNNLLCRKTATERFSTLFWGYYDSRTSILHYINAGHLPPLLIRAGEFGNLEVQRLEQGGPVLGLIPDAPYTQGRQMIRKGDLLVAFSDGISEATNFIGEEFGELRLVDAIRDSWNETAGDIRNAVLERVRSFVHTEQVHDDQTLFVVQFKPAAVQPVKLTASIAAPGEKRCLVAQ